MFLFWLATQIALECYQNPVIPVQSLLHWCNTNINSKNTQGKTSQTAPCTTFTYAGSHASTIEGKRNVHNIMCGNVSAFMCVIFAIQRTSLTHLVVWITDVSSRDHITMSNVIYYLFSYEVVTGTGETRYAYGSYVPNIYTGSSINLLIEQVNLISINLGFC